MIDFIYHLFIPNHRNNHRAKLLDNKSIFFLVFVLFFVGFATNLLTKTRPEVLGLSYSLSEEELLSYTNKAREKQGIAPLMLNPKLSWAAQQKAQDMFSRNYWAHFAPDGEAPWSFIKTSGYSYLYAGENLAKGFSSSNEVVDAWLDSPTHRDNMLSNKYKDVGFAIMRGRLNGENTVLVVEFLGSSEILQFANNQNTDKRQEAEQIAKNNLGSTLGESIKKTSVKIKPLINVFVASKGFLLVLFPILIATFLFDHIIVERKKIPRAVGHNIDHIILIAAFVLFLIFQKTGVIF